MSATVFFELRLNALDSPVLIRAAGAFTPLHQEEFLSAWSRCQPSLTVTEPEQPFEGEDRYPRPMTEEHFSAQVKIEGQETELLVEAADFPLFHETLTAHITLAAITRRSGQYPMLHACALGDPQSQKTAVFVASSGTGKSTLSRALGHRFEYATDETALILDGLVLPYPKPISTIPPDGGHKKQLSPDDLGLLPYLTPRPLGLLVLLNRRKPGDPPEQSDDVVVRKVPSGEALISVLPQSSGSSALARPFSELGELFRQAGGVYEITYTESSALEPVVLELLSASQPLAENPFEESLEDTGVHPLPEGGEECFRRSSQVSSSAWNEEDRFFVMGENRMVELEGLGKMIWDFLDSWHSAEEIEKYLSQELGDHPDSANLVRSALDTLLEEKLIMSHGGAVGVEN